MAGILGETVATAREKSVTDRPLKEVDLLVTPNRQMHGVGLVFGHINERTHDFTVGRAGPSGDRTEGGLCYE